MPQLAALLFALFAGLVEFLVKFFTRRIAIGVAFVAAYTGLVFALIGYIKILFFSLVGLFPANSYILMGFWMIIPTNFMPCVSVLLSAYLARAVFNYHNTATRWFALGGL